MTAEPYLLDANVVLRLIRAEPETQAIQAYRLFKAAERGELQLNLPSVILAQCVYVLDSFYEVARAEITDALREVIRLPGVVSAEADVLLAALNHFGRTRLEFADCYLAAMAQATSAGVASFDKDFKRMRDVRIFDWASLSD